MHSQNALWMGGHIRLLYFLGASYLPLKYLGVFEMLYDAMMMALSVVVGGGTVAALTAILDMLGD